MVNIDDALDGVNLRRIGDKERPDLIAEPFRPTSPEINSWIRILARKKRKYVSDRLFSFYKDPITLLNFLLFEKERSDMIQGHNESYSWCITPMASGEAGKIGGYSFRGVFDTENGAKFVKASTFFLKKLNILRIANLMGMFLRGLCNMLLLKCTIITQLSIYFHF